MLVTDLYQCILLLCLRYFLLRHYFVSLLSRHIWIWGLINYHSICKNLTIQKSALIFLHFQHVLEWEWIWYNLMSSKSLGCFTGSCKFALMLFWIKARYSVTLPIFCAFSNRIKACVYGLHLPWNLTNQA